ncbi:hypothetical protein LX32DRAFT_163450 [Colletotrichum zoysiae]|uniref:Uncharacterized protein n=1 Tax=Colletotrichum zoysiae TaxID=1216348 RepID=A0AAD9H7D5_9PEZI|nr:hypothetical protein LX32DRAFT_163450 [Colletotrichum zoysiae]
MCARRAQRNGQRHSLFSGVDRCLLHTPFIISSSFLVFYSFLFLIFFSFVSFTRRPRLGRLGRSWDNRWAATRKMIIGTHEPGPLWEFIPRETIE